MCCEETNLLDPWQVPAGLRAAGLRDPLQLGAGQREGAGLRVAAPRGRGPAGEGAATSKLVVRVALAIVAASVVVWLLLGLLPAQRAERFAERLTRLPRVGGSAAEFWRAVWMYRCRQGSVALALLISWAGHVNF